MGRVVTSGELIHVGEALTVLTLAGMVFPPVRRVFRAVCKFTLAHIPRWLAWLLAPVLAVCAVIPGQFDELGILAVVLAPVLVSGANRTELWADIRKAWKG